MWITFIHALDVLHLERDWTVYLLCLVKLFVVFILLPFGEWSCIYILHRLRLKCNCSCVLSGFRNKSSKFYKMSSVVGPKLKLCYIRSIVLMWCVMCLQEYDWHIFRLSVSQLLSVSHISVSRVSSIIVVVFLCCLYPPCFYSTPCNAVTEYIIT